MRSLTPRRPTKTTKGGPMSGETRLCRVCGTFVSEEQLVATTVRPADGSGICEECY